MKREIFLVLLIFLIFSSVSAQVDADNPACYRNPFMGDVNDDGIIDIGDPISLLYFLFQGEPLSCPSNANVNGDKIVDISDVVFLLNYLFVDSSQQLSSIDMPPFLKLIPGYDSELVLDTSLPVVVPLYDNFVDKDIIFCEGIAYDSNGIAKLLFSLGGEELIGPPIFDQYKFIIHPTDLDPGRYKMEITCHDEAGNIGFDISDLVIGREIRDPVDQNCRENIDTCCYTQLPSAPFKKYVCMKDCDYNEESGEDGTCLDQEEMCENYEPRCINVEGILAGDKITEKGDWQTADVSDCNLLINGEKAESWEEANHPICKASRDEIDFKIQDNEFIPLQTAPANKDPLCVVKYMTILYKYKDGKIGNDKVTLPGDLEKSIGEYLTNLGRPAPVGKINLFNPNGDERFQNGFIILATYQGIRKDGTLSEDVDTKDCREYQFVQSTINSLNGIIYRYMGPITVEEVISAKGLIDLDGEKKLMSKDSLLALDQRGRGNSLSPECAYGRSIDSSSHLCVDDYYQARFSASMKENREWTESLYNQAQRRFGQMATKKHNMQVKMNDESMAKSMFWYDAPGRNVNANFQNALIANGFIETRVDRFTAVSEDQSALHRITCILDGLGYKVGYDRIQNKNIRETIHPQSCKCYEQTRKTSADTWTPLEQGKNWDCQ